MRAKIASKQLIVGVVLAATAQAAALAGEETPNWIMDTSGVGEDRDGVVTSNQFLELGSATPSCLQLEGEAAMRLGDLDRALQVLQRSVELAPLDMDKRILYSQALEKKLSQAKKRDPKLYNYLVKQWLFIMKKAEFPDQKLQAGSHLIQLTGRPPKMWEKPQKYLQAVLIPEDEEDTGKQVADSPKARPQ